MKNRTDFYNIPYAHYPHTDGRYSPVEEKEFDHQWRLERTSLMGELDVGAKMINRTYRKMWKQYFEPSFYISFQPTSMRKYIQQLFCFNQSECYVYISADLTTTLFGKMFTCGSSPIGQYSFHFESPEICWINFSKGGMKYDNGSKITSYWV